MLGSWRPPTCAASWPPATAHNWRRLRTQHCELGGAFGVGGGGFLPACCLGCGGGWGKGLRAVRPLLPLTLMPHAHLRCLQLHHTTPLSLNTHTHTPHHHTGLAVAVTFPGTAGTAGTSSSATCMAHQSRTQNSSPWRGSRPLTTHHHPASLHSQVRLSCPALSTQRSPVLAPV